MVTLTREKKEKVIQSLKELPLLGSVITHYGAGRFDLYRRIARECGDIGLFHLGPYRVIQVVSSELVHSLLVEHANDFDKGEIPHKVFRSDPSHRYILVRYIEHRSSDNCVDLLTLKGFALETIGFSSRPGG